MTALHSCTSSITGDASLKCASIVQSCPNYLQIIVWSIFFSCIVLLAKILLWSEPQIYRISSEVGEKRRGTLTMDFYLFIEWTAKSIPQETLSCLFYIVIYIVSFFSLHQHT